MDKTAKAVPTAQTSEQSTEYLYELIRHSCGGVIRSLQVDNQPGFVRVSGHTDSYYHKQIVTQTILPHLRHTRLSNEITVTLCPK